MGLICLVRAGQAAWVGIDRCSGSRWTWCPGEDFRHGLMEFELALLRDRRKPQFLGVADGGPVVSNGEEGICANAPSLEKWRLPAVFDRSGEIAWVGGHPTAMAFSRPLFSPPAASRREGEDRSAVAAVR